MTLLYLYWEPANAAAHGTFSRHREEVARLAAMVEGAEIPFTAISYPELWAQWEAQDRPAWLAGHVAALRRRYLVTV